MTHWLYGDVDESRLDQYLPLSMVRAQLSERFTLEDIDYQTGGPARYARVAETLGIGAPSGMKTVAWLPVS